MALDVDFAEMDPETAALIREMMSGMSEEEMARVASAEAELKTAEDPETFELMRMPSDGGVSVLAAPSSFISGVSDSVKAEVAKERGDLLKSMFEDRACADVILRCTDADTGAVVRDVGANRAFLAAVSEVWREELTAVPKSEMPMVGDTEAGACDSICAVIEVKGAAPELVESIVRYSCFLEPNVSIRTAMPLRFLCRRLKVSGLESVCDSLLSERSMNPTSICELLTMALENEFDSLAKTCVQHIESKFKGREFKRMFESDGFQQMPSAALRELLKCNTLGVKEEELFQYLVQWATTQVSLADTQSMATATTKPKPKEEEVTAKKDVMHTAIGLGFDGAYDEYYDGSDDLVLVSVTEPKKVSDFLGEVKHLIRFASMEVGFLLTEVAATGILTLTEEYVLMRLKAAPELPVDTPLPITSAQLNAETKRLLKEEGTDSAKPSADGGHGDDDDGDTDEKESTAVIIPDIALTILSTEKRKGAISIECAKVFARSISTATGSFSYNSSMDALRISVDTGGCTLVAVGLLCAAGVSNAMLIIYSPDNDLTSEVVHMEAMQTFTLDARNSEPQPFVFEFPFEMEAAVTYCVELHQTNTSGESSFQAKSCQKTIAVTEDSSTVTLTVSKASNSPNGTSTSSGAFPCFYICF